MQEEVDEEYIRWMPGEIELLIEGVRERPDLYDYTRPGYSNQSVIDNCWREISSQIVTKDGKK